MNTKLLHIVNLFQGIEDYYGDMDFKIAGTETGITAIQADVKILGLPMKVVSQAISLGQDGILRILNIMNNVIKAPRFVFLFSPCIVLH